MKSKEMKSFESRMREDTHHYYVDGLTYIRDRDALAIAQEADHAVSELRVALESFADFVAHHMPSNGFDATMVRTEIVAVREYLERTK